MGNTLEYLKKEGKDLVDQQYPVIFLKLNTIERLQAGQGDIRHRYRNDWRFDSQLGERSLASYNLANHSLP